MSAVMAEARDPRAANRLKPEHRVVHARLEAWGRWSRDNKLALSYASENTIHKMIVFGLVGAAGEGAPIEMPEAIAEVDAAIGCLPVTERGAIRRYYLRWEAIDATAAMLGINVRELQRLLSRARDHVMWTLNIRGLPGI